MPTRAGDPDFLDRLRQLAPDCCPVVAYGALLPAAALEIPRHGWVNLHFSLLPAWRGAAPVQHAIMAGDEITGASTFLLEGGLDTGAGFGTVTEGIAPRDTAGGPPPPPGPGGGGPPGAPPRPGGPGGGGPGWPPRPGGPPGARGGPAPTPPRASAWRPASGPPTPGWTGPCRPTPSTAGSAGSRRRPVPGRPGGGNGCDWVR